jgi:hypothetical protein
MLYDSNLRGTPTGIVCTLAAVAVAVEAADAAALDEGDEAAEVTGSQRRLSG